MEHRIMGDLPGHIFPGLAFLVWALWWTAADLRRHNADRISAGALESWCKIGVPIVEMIGELRWIGYADVRATVVAHIAADILVIASGVTDLLVARGRLPRRAEHGMLSAAFVGIAMLLTWHGQHGAVANRAHVLFASCLFTAGVLVQVEAFRPGQVVRALRTYAVALAGVWFMHTGWLLYASGADLMSDAMAKRAAWMFGVDGVALALLLGATLWGVRRRMHST